MAVSLRKEDLDPKGGLTASGRRRYNRATGGRLRPGVQGAADTPEKLRRKGSFLVRFYTNPSGPLVDKGGEPTRLALAARAWGETYQETQLSSSELLPKGEIGASWAAVNPVGSEDLKGQNFLQAGYHSNINVVGIAQTNRNASWDIRSELPNPQSKVGPFLNTTIDPDPFKSSRAVEGLTA
jgi:hypothetical protein